MLILINELRTNLLTLY